jgi:hypothetical protein
MLLLLLQIEQIHSLKFTQQQGERENQPETTQTNFANSECCVCVCVCANFVERFLNKQTQLQSLWLGSYKQIT